jgi:hypothetical protein
LTDPVNRSAEELAMRAMMDAELRYAFPQARIIHELGLRYSTNSIDIAAVTAHQIIGVEIKSSRDTLDRLEKQVRAFAPFCSLVFIAVAPRWVDQAQRIAERCGAPNVIVEACCAATGRIVVDPFWVAHRTQRHGWALRQLDALRVSELEIVAAQFGVAPRSSHAKLVDSLCDHLTGREVRRAVCDTLRHRVSPNPMSDPPTEAAPRVCAA